MVDLEIQVPQIRALEQHTVDLLEHVDGDAQRGQLLDGQQLLQAAQGGHRRHGDFQGNATKLLVLGFEAIYHLLTQHL